MDTRPIGVFDSGLGGLTVVRQLLNILPHEDIVYFGDTGRVPYGTRSPETIRAYARQDCRFLQRQEVKLIIAACGTVSSVAPAVLSDLPVPGMGVVEPTAAAAIAATKNHRIGVIATAATVRSDSFGQELRRADPTAQVVSAACPLFVPLVENGWIEPDNDATIAVVRRYLQPLKDAGVDTLILGCTHFPLLVPTISTFMGPDVTLIDSGTACSLRCRDWLTDRKLMTDRSHTGICQFYVSDRPDNFTRVAEMFLGRAVDGQIHQIPIEELGQ